MDGGEHEGRGSDGWIVPEMRGFCIYVERVAHVAKTESHILSSGVCHHRVFQTACSLVIFLLLAPQRWKNNSTL